MNLRILMFLVPLLLNVPPGKDLSWGSAMAATYSIPHSEPSRLKKALAPQVKAHEKQSGFHFLKTGKEAFNERIALVQAAQKTLDLQYYIVEADLTGKFILEEILRAADRGVRVRILVDELHMDKADQMLAVVNTHRNIQIRGFNPVSTKEDSFFSRVANWVTEFQRYTRRMHNKALIADNQVAIIGGRNLGDEYFDARSDFNFSDLDVLVTGQAVVRVSNSFDRYWNSDQVFDFDSLHAPESDPALVAETRKNLSQNWNHEIEVKFQKNLSGATMPERLENGALPLLWANAEFSADAPEKIDEKATSDSVPMNRLDRLLDHATEEFIAVTPYMVPGEGGVEWMKGIMKRGVKIKILTNSLASTDVFAVHAAYRKYRDDMIKAGVELYELKPIPGKKTRQNLLGSSSRSSLHSKVYVVDRRYVVIGSFNLDPRSIELNTELGMVVDSPALAKEIVVMFDEAVAPEISYHIVLDGKGRTRWETVEKGKPTTYKMEPHAGLWRRFLTRISPFLLSEDQL